MKRAALGALLISLVAGSTAFAGTVLPPALHNGGNDDRGREQHRPDYRNDNNRGSHDRRDDRGDNWNRDNDHRWDGRRDDHRWDNNRNDGRWDDHRNDRRWDNDRRWNDNNRRYEGRWDDRRWDNGRGDNHRWNPPRYVSPPHYSYSPPRHDYRWEDGRWHWGSYYRPYGYAPRYWRRGDRLPVAYYGPSYVIGNYYDCGLREPPYGYHWVRVDHDVVLAAIATGVVLDVIYNQFW
jgi:Ni/Co efflux regulator RcnB